MPQFLGLDWGYVICILLFVLGLYLIMSALEKVIKRKPKEPEYYIENVNSLNVTPDDFYKVINFMLMYGVIDLEEYTKIQNKGLPYTG